MVFPMSSWQERRSKLVNLIVVNAVAAGFGGSLLIIGVHDSDAASAGIGVVLVLLSAWIMARAYRDVRQHRQQVRLRVHMKV